MEIFGAAWKAAEGVQLVESVLNEVIERTGVLTIGPADFLTNEDARMVRLIMSKEGVSPVRELRVWNLRINSAAAELALAVRNSIFIERLCLGGGLSGVSFSRFRKSIALRNNGSPLSLSLAENGLGGEAFAMGIASLLRLECLSSLDISRGALPPSSCSRFGKLDFFEHSSPPSLVGNRLIGDRIMETMSSAIANSTALTHLDLSCVHAPSDLRHSAHFLHLGGPVVILCCDQLAACGIKDDAVVCLALSLRSSGLMSLNLSNNPFGQVRARPRPFAASSSSSLIPSSAGGISPACKHAALQHLSSDPEDISLLQLRGRSRARPIPHTRTDCLLAPHSHLSPLCLDPSL